MESILVPLGFFALVVMIVRIASDNHVRKEIIKKTQGDEINTAELFKPIFHTSGKASLRWGLILVCCGVLLFLKKIYPDFFTNEILVGTILSLSGIILVVEFFFNRKK